MAPADTRRTAGRLALIALALAAITVLLLARPPGTSRTAGTDADAGEVVEAATPHPATAGEADPVLREAAAWAGRGAWDSASVALERYVEGRRGRPDALVDAYGLAAVGAWMGVLGRDRVDGFRRALRRDEARLSAPLAAEVAWLDGLLAFVDHDGRGMDEARLRIREADARLASDLERSVRAFQLALDGDEVRAARLLRRLERDRADRSSDSGRPERRVAFLTPVNRIAAAHWFIRNGRSADAIELLERPAPATSASGGVADLALAAFIHLQRARAGAALGREQAARGDFREFVRRYDLPEGPARGWVRDAREALGDEIHPGR